MAMVPPPPLAVLSPNKRKKHDQPSSNAAPGTDDEDDQPVVKRSRTVLVPATQTGEEEGNEDDEMENWHDAKNGEKDRHVKPVARNGRANGHANAQTNGNVNDDADHGEEENVDNIKYEEVEDEDGAIIRRLKVVRKAYTRDNDGFVKGSIIRVRMSNFVTYDYVDFKPGPNLNMIIGPNGTGKSTIVCGITLGLGWQPKVLGRATEISAFVKQGHERGWVEITLKNEPGKPDITIKREINRRDKKSVWAINDRPATMQQVSDTTSKLDIQVGNLCSFLPQDKVAEFAQMTPTTLLTETMKAAGDPGLTGWHQTLVTDGAEKRRIDEDLEKGEERLEAAEERANELQPQVDLLRNRQALQKKIANLRALVSAKEYWALRNEIHALKEEKIKANKEKKRLEERHQPLKDLQEHVGQKLFKAASKSRTAITRQNDQIDVMIQALGRQTREEQKFEELNNSIQAITREEPVRKDRITKYKTTIASLEKQVENPPDIIDDTPLRKQQAEISTKRRAKAEQIAEADAQKDALANRSKQLDQMREQKTAELQRLKDVRRRRMQDLSQRNASCGYAMKWIEDNRDKFDHEVFFPPAVSLDVSDRRYSPIVEALINSQQMLTFVCQSEKDYKTLNQLNDDRRHICHYNGREQKVMINTITITERDLEEPTDMLSPAQLEGLGLDCYAIQLCDAKPHVLAFLRTQANLHRTACSLSRINGDVVEAAGILSYGEWLADDAKPRGSVTRVNISAYGSRAKQSSSRVIYAARVLASSVDQEQVTRVSDEVAEISTRKRVLEGDSKKAYDLKMRLSKEEETLREQLTEIKEKIAQSQNAHKRWKKAGVDLELHRNRLEEALLEPTADVRRAELKAQIITVVRARVKAMRDHHAACESVTRHTTSRVETELAFIQATANKNAIDAKWNARSARCSALDEKIQQIADESARKLAKATEIRPIFQQRCMELNAEDRQQCNVDAQNPDKTLEDVKQELADAKSEMGLIPEMDRGIIERLQQIREEVKQRRKEVEKTRKDTVRLATSISSTMAKFDPALTTLVETVSKKFSSALERIGCAGEVRIRKHADDYALWALEILVKFRDEEELQVLTAQRQSGGERSLSTIMYLMSLTELARTPFSLVDEINQGMDQRAERAVHDQLVETTCNENAGQYFLITPKLLTGLRYDERMKVLCINNGEYLPDPQTSKGPGPGDLLAYLQKRREKKARGRA